MKVIISFFLLLLSASVTKAQCPDLNAAMVNACGTPEGENEFVIFTTAVTAQVSTYTLHYGTANPPITNSMAGSDATTITGTGSITASGCTIVSVTSPTTSIPSGSRVLFISANFTQAYDLSSYCAAGTLYVVYIKLNANGGINSNWTTGGTMANTLAAGVSRYLQVTYTGSASCNGTNAPVKSYMDMWASNTDGNFVLWSGATASYGNTGCTTVLPVSLVSFNASYKAGAAILSWQTATEINTDHFEIQRSFDGNHFTRIGDVTAAGNSTIIKNYTYTDRNIQYKATYYRLKEIDRNGFSNFSNVARINPSANGLSINNIYPKPATGTVNIEWNSDIAGQSKIIIRDMSGRTLKTGELMSHSGYNKYLLNIENISKGIYVIELQCEGRTAMATFLKQ
jgi:hypothetical protein